MPSFDIYAFYESAAKNGLTLIAAAAGHRKGIVAGDNIEITKPGTAFRSEMVSAAIANAVQFRLHKTTDNNAAVRSRAGFIRDQTDICRQLAEFNYPIKAGEILNAYGDNGNNAQVEAVIVMVADGDAVPYFSDKPPAPIPKDAFLMDVTGGTALVAGTWTESVVTTNAILERNAEYQILGVAMQSAGMIACGLVPRGKTNQEGFFPGVPGGDLPGEAVMWFSDAFPSFEGANLPNLFGLSVSADAAQYGTWLVRKIGTKQ